MHEVRELLDAGDDARARARVVRVRVDRDDAHRQVGEVRLARGSFGVEPAAREHDELGASLEDGVP